MDNPEIFSVLKDAVVKDSILSIPGITDYKELYDKLKYDLIRNKIKNSKPVLFIDDTSEYRNSVYLKNDKIIQSASKLELKYLVSGLMHLVYTDPESNISLMTLLHKLFDVVITSYSKSEKEDFQNDLRSYLPETAEEIIQKYDPFPLRLALTCNIGDSGILDAGSWSLVFRTRNYSRCLKENIIDMASSGDIRISSRVPEAFLKNPNYFLDDMGYFRTFPLINDVNFGYVKKVSDDPSDPVGNMISNPAVWQFDLIMFNTCGSITQKELVRLFKLDDTGIIDSEENDVVTRSQLDPQLAIPQNFDLMQYFAINGYSKNGISLIYKRDINELSLQDFFRVLGGDSPTTKLTWELSSGKLDNPDSMYNV